MAVESDDQAVELVAGLKLTHLAATPNPVSPLNNETTLEWDIEGAIPAEVELHLLPLNYPVTEPQGQRRTAPGATTTYILQARVRVEPSGDEAGAPAHWHIVELGSTPVVVDTSECVQGVIDHDEARTIIERALGELPDGPLTLERSLLVECDQTSMRIELHGTADALGHEMSIAVRMGVQAYNEDGRVRFRYKRFEAEAEYPDSWFEVLTLGLAELAESKVERWIHDNIGPVILDHLEASLNHLAESLERLGLKLCTLRIARDGIHYMAAPV